MMQHEDKKEVYKTKSGNAVYLVDIIRLVRHKDRLNISQQLRTVSYVEAKNGEMVLLERFERLRHLGQLNQFITTSKTDELYTRRENLDKALAEFYKQLYRIDNRNAIGTANVSRWCRSICEDEKSADMVRSVIKGHIHLNQSVTIPIYIQSLESKPVYLGTATDLKLSATDPHTVLIQLPPWSYSSNNLKLVPVKDHNVLALRTAIAGVVRLHKPGIELSNAMKTATVSIRIDSLPDNDKVRSLVGYINIEF